jgi:hypothetical protein
VTEAQQFGGLDNAQALTADLLDDFQAMQFFRSFCDMVIKQDMTTPIAPGLDQAGRRHPCSQR